MSYNAPLDWKDIKNSAAKFSIRFKDAKKEESYKQTFWNEFFQMFGIDAIEVGMYEQFVKKFDNHAGEIDYFWPGKLIIEHKSAGKDLDAAYNQAMDYILGIEDRKKWPRYIIVSDFKRIRLIDIVEHHDDTILLSDLVNHIEKFSFLAGYNNKRIEGQHPVNVKAAEVMGRLYDLLKESNYPEEDLDTLLIRLVFCMFAEDADIFEKNIFSAYLEFHTNDDGAGMGGALTEIFAVLDTPLENRQTTMISELRNFPYVNGGLFSKQIYAPSFNREMRDILFEASRLDWRYISPAIFGSLFQCIMDPAMRRELGAHYTSEDNILKLINPLFMDNLRHDFQVAKGNKKALIQLWDKMSMIRILDPACGCGNFLIISYREMRLLEMDLLKELYGNQMVLDESHLYVDHYYGIEIGEFASMVANLSIILMDHLMNLEMRNRFGQSRDIIPLKEKANIVCANSLKLDWSEIVDPNDLTYIVGNPPFVGAKIQTDEQRMDMLPFFKKNAGIMDYVAAWYVKASNMMAINPKIRTAFVSTNSITQGEQVEPLWKPIFESGFKINYAYHTFKWSNEAKGVAAVHVIIVSFSLQTLKPILFDIIDNQMTSKLCKHINAYLVDGPDIFLLNRSKPICNVPEIGIGNKPIDDGNYLFTKEEMQQFVELEPRSQQYFHPWIGSREFINGESRYCLWLGDCTPSELNSLPHCLKRIEAVRDFRLSSKSEGTRKLAERPTRFHVENIPTSPYLVIPEVSSEKREYVPIGFMDQNTFASNLVKVMPNATLYHFGVVTSKMHMVWMRYVCGRMKSDYRYSVGIVYNNFPWPDVDEHQIKAIESAAQHVLDARNNHPNDSFALLYDPITMPEDLRKAHSTLDAEVEKAYNSKGFKSDNDRIVFLFSKYCELTSN